MLWSILLILMTFFIKVFSLNSCGISSNVHEGKWQIEKFPWLGFLYYPYCENKMDTTGVVLVTRQIVIASAIEIDRLPKHNFRAKARVVLGHNCSGQPIKVREYSYHPEFTNFATVSTIAIIQLELDTYYFGLQYICPPLSNYHDPVYYAMVLSKSCKNPIVTIHKMKHVSFEDCKNDYKGINLDGVSMWPTHTICATSIKKGKCVWRNGAILTVKVDNKWTLAGFGFYGPGCGNTSRFLDYSRYHNWVKKTILNIGKQTITNIADNHIVMRRMPSNIQRFGDCDDEEKSKKLHVDSVMIARHVIINGSLTYNLSLFGNVEYSCIILKAEYVQSNLFSIEDTRLSFSQSTLDFTARNTYKCRAENSRNTKLKVQIRCRDDSIHCMSPGLETLDFYVEIYYEAMVDFYLEIYGSKPKQITDYRSLIKLNLKTTE